MKNIINSKFLGNAAFEGCHIHKEATRDAFVKQTEANRLLGLGYDCSAVNIRFESCLFPSAEFDCRESSRLNHSVPLPTLCAAGVSDKLTQCSQLARKPTGGKENLGSTSPHVEVRMVGNGLWRVAAQPSSSLLSSYEKFSRN